MTDLDTLLSAPPYALTAAEKETGLLPMLLELTRRHQALCPPYAAMLSALDVQTEACHSLEQLPALPVGLFKRLELRSTPGEEGRAITSSGTTGQAVSRVWVDGETAALQRQALALIAGDFLGPRRLPMLILDTPQVLRPPLRDSARGAGVLGFSACASQRVFALREDLSLDVDALETFLSELAGRPFFLFGFTFMVWRHFYEALRDRGVRLDCSGGTLIHGGGWKKLADRAVSRESFHRALKQTCRLDRIYDYYGMAEQAGSIFMECDRGHLHCSSFSQVVIRRAADFSVCPPGEEGIVQVLSVLPRSYPGHSLLTEDKGVLLGEDDCPCGRKGRYFKVLGRMPGAELRGCSDVIAASL